MSETDGFLWDDLVSALNGLENALRATADDMVKANAEFAASSGLTAKIVRSTSGECCAWCSSIAGTYTYGSEPKDVYRRHNNCDCTVEYVTSKGSQNVHSKKWTRASEADKIEERKNIGLQKKIKISSKQFGKKAGKHAADFGLDAANPDDREELLRIIELIVGEPDEIRQGEWRGQVGLCDFYIKGSDAVVANDDEFVTVLKDGAVNSGRIKNAGKRKIQ